MANGKPRPIGPFSFLVLKTLAKLPAAQRYGARVEEKASKKMKGTILPARIYVTLSRLESKRLITGKLAASPTAPGHTVMLYRLTEKGTRALQVARNHYGLLAAA